MKMAAHYVAEELTWFRVLTQVGGRSTQAPLDTEQNRFVNEQTLACMTKGPVFPPPKKKNLRQAISQRCHVLESPKSL